MSVSKYDCLNTGKTINSNEFYFNNFMQMWPVRVFPLYLKLQDRELNPRKNILVQMCRQKEYKTGFSSYICLVYCVPVHVIYSLLQEIPLNYSNKTCFCILVYIQVFNIL